MSISLKRKKIFQKEKGHSFVFRNTFQIGRKKFHVIYTLRWSDVVGQILLASTIAKEGFHILLNLGIEQRFILLLVLPKYLFSKLVIK